MPKALCLIGMVIAALILVLFSLDLVTGIPFKKAHRTLDISFILCALGLAYLSWATFREQD